MFTFSLREKGSQRLRSAALVAGLGGLMTVASAQTSFVNPEIYDLGTAYADFAGRGSLEFNPPTRSNVWILGNSNPLAQEPVRGSNPWASVLGLPQVFELNYNVDTGDLSWSLLGTMLTTNYKLQDGYGLAYLQPSIKVQTPTGANNNLGNLTDLQVTVNGGAPQNYGSLFVSGNDFHSSAIYFTDYNVHTLKVTGNIAFEMPEAWSNDINGSFADIEVLSAKPVPEPATMAVLGIGAAALLRRRKRK